MNSPAEECRLMGLKKLIRRLDGSCQILSDALADCHDEPFEIPSGEEFKIPMREIARQVSELRNRAEDVWACLPEYEFS